MSLLKQARKDDRSSGQKAFDGAVTVAGGVTGYHVGGHLSHKSAYRKNKNAATHTTGLQQLKHKVDAQYHKHHTINQGRKAKVAAGVTAAGMGASALYSAAKKRMEKKAEETKNKAATAGASLVSAGLAAGAVTEAVKAKRYSRSANKADVRSHGAELKSRKYAALLDRKKSLMASGRAEKHASKATKLLASSRKHGIRSALAGAGSIAAAGIAGRTHQKGVER